VKKKIVEKSGKEKKRGRVRCQVFKPVVYFYSSFDDRRNFKLKAKKIGQVAVAYGAFAGTILGVSYVIDKAREIFEKKPERPLPPPPDSFNISQDDSIRNTQVKLNMDARNDYNYALCGPRGTGRDIRIGGC
jgi:hypothetical protein